MTLTSVSYVLIKYIMNALPLGNFTCLKCTRLANDPVLAVCGHLFWLECTHSAGAVSIKPSALSSNARFAISHVMKLIFTQSSLTLKANSSRRNKVSQHVHLPNTNNES